MDNLTEVFKEALIAKNFESLKDIAIEVTCLSQSDPLFAAIAAMHPDECDLSDVLDSTPNDFIHQVSYCLLPSISLASVFRLADAYAIFRFADRENSHFNYEVITCLSAQLERNGDIFERLRMDYAQGRIEGDAASQVLANAMAMASPKASANLAAKILLSQGTPRLVAKLILGLDCASTEVIDVLQPHQSQLAATLDAAARSNPEDRTVWHALLSVARFSEAAMKSLWRTLREGPIQGLRAIAEWLTWKPNCVLGSSPQFMQEILMALLEWVPKELSLCLVVDPMLGRLLYQENTRSLARALLLRLNELVEDVDANFPQALNVLAARHNDFAFVFTNLLVSPGESISLARKLISQFTRESRLIAIDFDVFADADLAGRKRLIRRLLALIHNGPVICQMASFFAEAERVNRYGIGIAEDMFNYIKDEYPSASEDFFALKKTWADKRAPSAALYRGLYANVLRWKRVLRRLPKLNELNPGESQMFTYRQYRRQEQREIMRGAGENSILAKLATPIHIAQGGRYAAQTHHGGTQIMEFHKVSTSFELPSSERADPVGGMLRRIRMAVVLK